MVVVIRIILLALGIRRRREQVQVQAGLKTGDQVVISPLKTVTEGMTIRPVLQKEAVNG